MTAYGISPVGARGVERDREQVIDIPSRYEMYQQIEQLRDELERVQVVAANEGQWKINARRAAAESEAVLRDLACMSAQMAAAVSKARAKVRRADRDRGA